MKYKIEKYRISSIKYNTIILCTCIDTEGNIDEWINKWKKVKRIYELNWLRMEWKLRTNEYCFQLIAEI